MVGGVEVEVLVTTIVEPTGGTVSSIVVSGLLGAVAFGGGVGGGVPGSVAGGVAGGVDGGVAGGIVGGAVGGRDVVGSRGEVGAILASNVSKCECQESEGATTDMWNYLTTLFIRRGSRRARE